MSLFLLLPLVFLLSCTPKEVAPPSDPESASSVSLSSSSLPTSEDSSSSSSAASVDSAENTEENPEVYSEDYIVANGEEALLQDVVRKGKRVLLFFSGENCTSCNDTSATLKALYAAETFPYSTYSVDFDSALTLREQYGVTVADTLLLLDGEGQALQIVISPSEMDLRYLLATR